MTDPKVETKPAEPVKEKQLMMPGGPGTLANIGIDLKKLEKDAKLGGELGMQDIAAPYLYLLQTNSPQVNTDHEKHIEGAIASMFYLTVVEKVYDGRKEGIRIIPCHYERQITEWIDRDAGGGLVRSYPAGDTIMDRAKPDDKNRMRLPNGHLLIDTAYHYVMMEDPNTKIWHQCIMPLKSTMLKKSRRWNSEISSTKIPDTTVKAPRFLYIYRAKTMKEQKDDNVWNVPDFVKEDMVDAQLYNQAKLFSQVAAETTLRRPPAEAEAEAIKSTGKTLDDDIPF
jgi:hypothetical protein